MVSLDLSDPKAELLREVLVSYLSELRMEIAYSPKKELRDFLKKRGEELEELLRIVEEKLAESGRNPISIDRLRKVDVLQGLTDWELKVVAQFLRDETVAEGVTLFEEGQKADRLFILEAGEVMVRLPRGESYPIRTPGKIIGWSFLIPPNRYTASGQTVVPSSLLVMQSPDFYYLIHKEPRMGVKVMANLAQVVAGCFSGPVSRDEAGDDPGASPALAGVTSFRCSGPRIWPPAPFILRSQEGYRSVSMIKISSMVGTPDLKAPVLAPYSGDLPAAFDKLAKLGYDGVEFMTKDPSRLDGAAIRRWLDEHKLS